MAENDPAAGVCPGAGFFVCPGVSVFPAGVVFMKQPVRIFLLLPFLFSLLYGLPSLEAAEKDVPAEWTFSSTSYVWFSGLRYWNLKNELTIRTASAPPQRFTDTRSWLDPLVGIRFSTQLSPKLGFTAIVDAGGFGMGSDFTRGGMVDFSWRLSERTSLEVGYRYLCVDYEKDGFMMDAYNDGLFIGFTWKLK